MRRGHRGIGLVLVVGSTLLASGSAPAEVPQGRCAKDALEKWYCATDAKGVAVVDNLGAVVCSPGRCVEVKDEWECSAVSGGGAELTPDGPVCDGGCRSPRAVDCDHGMGPA